MYHNKMAIQPQVIKRESANKQEEARRHETDGQGSRRGPEKLVSLYASLIVKRGAPFPRDSRGSAEPRREEVDSEHSRTKSRISFFRNERLAEKLSRNQSLKKVKSDADHLGILSVINDKNKHTQPIKATRAEEPGEEPN